MHSFFNRHHLHHQGSLMDLMHAGLSHIVDADHLRQERRAWLRELDSIVEADEFMLRDMGITRDEVLLRLSALRNPS